MVFWLLTPVCLHRGVRGVPVLTSIGLIKELEVPWSDTFCSSSATTAGRQPAGCLSLGWPDEVKLVYAWPHTGAY